MAAAFTEDLRGELAHLKEGGLYKAERVITSPQSATITVAGGAEVLNFCANNYLGLADHPDLVAAAESNTCRALTPRRSLSSSPRIPYTTRKRSTASSHATCASPTTCER